MYHPHHLPFLQGGRLTAERRKTTGLHLQNLPGGANPIANIPIHRRFGLTVTGVKRFQRIMQRTFFQLPYIIVHNTQNRRFYVTENQILRLLPATDAVMLTLCGDSPPTFQERAARTLGLLNMILIVKGCLWK